MLLANQIDLPKLLTNSITNFTHHVYSPCLLAKFTDQDGLPSWHAQLAHPAYLHDFLFTHILTYSLLFLFKNKLPLMIYNLHAGEAKDVGDLHWQGQQRGRVRCGGL